MAMMWLKKVSKKMNQNNILNDIIVVDNLFEDHIIKNMWDHIIHEQTCWTMGDSTSLKEETILRQDGNIFEYFQFVHSIILNGRVISNVIELLDPITERIENFFNVKSELLFSRIKINFQPKFLTDKIYNTPHVDVPNYHHVFMVYLNDSDGPTYIFENDCKPWNIKKIIEPKRGRFLCFPGNLYHAGRHPRISDCRVAINFNCLNLKECI